MSTPKRPVALALAAALLVALSACDESAPTTVASTPTPAPAKASPGSTQAPSASVKPGPSPSPTPTPSPNPLDAYKLVFLKPDPAEEDHDFTVVQNIETQGTGTNVSVKDVAVYYDNRLLMKKTSSTASLKIQDWDPNLKAFCTDIKDPETSDQKFGEHVLRVTITTTKGDEKSTTLTFNKPVAFRGWQSPAPIALPAPRKNARAVSTQDRLYLFWGRTTGGAAYPTIDMLSVKASPMPVPAWVDRPLGGLDRRENPGLAAYKDYVYILGGDSDGGGSLAALSGPTNSARCYQVFTQDAVEVAIPDLPEPLVGAAAAVLNGYLYVVGGSSSGAYASAKNVVYRLQLDSDGKPYSGGSWQSRAEVPVNDAGARMNASLVVYGGRLYLVGGRGKSGTAAEPLLRFDGTTWARQTLLRTGVYDAAAGVIGDDLWVFGGYDGTGARSKAFFRYDLAKSQVVEMESDAPLLPAGLAGMGYGVADGQMYLIGGDEGAADPQTRVLRSDIL